MCTTCTHMELWSPAFQRLHDFLYVRGPGLLRNCAMLQCPMFLLANLSAGASSLALRVTPTRYTCFHILLLMSHNVYCCHFPSTEFRHQNFHSAEHLSTCPCYLFVIVHLWAFQLGKKNNP